MFMQITKEEVDDYSSKSIPHCEFVVEWTMEGKDMIPQWCKVLILGTTKEDSFFRVHFPPSKIAGMHCKFTTLVARKGRQ